MIPILGEIVEAAAGYFKARQERKVREAEIDGKLQEIKLQAMSAAENAEIALSIAQVNTAKWRADWFTFLFSIPLIMAFHPKTAAIVKAGFEVLDGMPTWYKVYLGSAVAASFGLYTLNRVWQWWHS